MQGGCWAPLKYDTVVRRDKPGVDATRQISLQIKELSTKSKRENEICVSQCPISQMETTINNLNRGNVTQSISDKGVGIAVGTKAEGTATYSVVPAGNTKGAVLPRAHPHQLLLLLSLLPPLFSLLRGELLPDTYSKISPTSPFQFPTISSHWQTLTGRKARNKYSFQMWNPHSLEDGIDRQQGDTDMSQHSPPLYLLSLYHPYLNFQTVQSLCPMLLPSRKPSSRVQTRTHSSSPQNITHKSNWSLPPSLAHVNSSSSSVTKPT